MIGAPAQSFVFSVIPSNLAPGAFAFHQSHAENQFLWLRDEEKIAEYATSNRLFGVREMPANEFVGLCYGALGGDHENEWEIGGITVSQVKRGLHLGTFLVRFAVSHTIAFNRPWHDGQEIIAHVHEENNAPRNVLARNGFEFATKVEVPGNVAPPSMKRNTAGNVPGDLFRFLPKATQGLLDWFKHEFKGTLDDDKTPAIFETYVGLGALIAALEEAVAGLPL